MQDETASKRQPLVAQTRQPCTGPSCDGVDPSADDVASDAGCRRLRRDTHPQLLPHPHARKLDRDVPPERPGRRGRLEVQLNWFLRDWRVERPAQMDPRLFDIIWEVYREVRFVAAHQHHLGLSFSRNQRRPAPPLERGRGTQPAHARQGHGHPPAGCGDRPPSRHRHEDAVWRRRLLCLLRLRPRGYGQCARVAAHDSTAARAAVPGRQDASPAVERQAAVRIRAGEGGDPCPQRRHGCAGLGRRRPVHRRIVRQSLRPQECRAGAGNGEAEHRDDGGLRRSGEHPGRRSGRSASAAAAARDSACQRACA